MEEQLGEVVRAVKALAKGAGAGGDDEGIGGPPRWGIGFERAGKMDVSTVLQGEHGQRIAVAVVKVAQKIESSVKKVVAASATPSAPKANSSAIVIK